MNDSIIAQTTSERASDERALPTISVCICTYKRPEMLQRLLCHLDEQETEGRFAISIVVADNDRLRSAESTVAEFASAHRTPITYCVEPEQNISLTRNRAIANATGDLIAFIDDDEFPERRWLLILFDALKTYQSDGVLGPVKCHYEQTPPNWVIKGKFYERRTYPTGTVIHWTMGRTGNVLLRREIFESDEPAFSPNFHRAGDQDFFCRMIEKGHVFVWCHEAVAYEVVPPARWTRSFMLKRALLRGTIGMQHAKASRQRVLKALIAVPIYTIALPFAFILGQHQFMAVLIRLLDHLGSLLTFLGIRPVKSQLITD